MNVLPQPGNPSFAWRMRCLQSVSVNVSIVRNAPAVLGLITFFPLPQISTTKCRQISGIFHNYICNRHHRHVRNQWFLLSYPFFLLLLLAPQPEVLDFGLLTNGSMNCVSKVVPLRASPWKASMSTTAISFHMLPRRPPRLTLPVNHWGVVHFSRVPASQPLVGIYSAFSLQ